MTIADKFYNIALAIDVSYFEGLTFVREEKCDTFPNEILCEYVADMAIKQAVSIDDVTDLYSDVQIYNTIYESVKRLTFSDNSVINIIYSIQSGERYVNFQFNKFDKL